jgi:hypothetical protein
MRCGVMDGCGRGDHAGKGSFTSRNSRAEAGAGGICRREAAQRGGCILRMFGPTENPSLANFHPNRPATEAFPFKVIGSWLAVLRNTRRKRSSVAQWNLALDDPFRHSRPSSIRTTTIIKMVPMTPTPRCP